MNFINKLFERKKALKAHKKGISYYNEKEFVKAIEQFEIMLSEKSLSKTIEYNLSRFFCSQAHRNIGIIQFAKGKNEEALQHFNIALTYNPNHTDLNYFIGICLNNIGKFQEAIESLNKLQKIDPSNIPNKLKMGIIFYNLGMWDNAEQINRNVLEKKPDYADVHYHLGLCLLSQGKALEAVESFSHALDLNPDYFNARLKLSIAQANLGLFEDAFKNLSQILKMHPEYADVNYLYGILKGECDEIEEGIKYLKEAIKLNPRYKNAHIKLILFYCKALKVDQAVKQISKVTQYYPEDNRLDSAKRLVDKMVNISDANSDGFSGQLEQIFGEEQLLVDLVNEFYEYLDIIPNFSEIISLFSNSKYIQEDESISEFMIPLIWEHIDRNPEYPDLYNSLGSQFIYNNKLLEAEAAFKKAVELNPNYITARINLMKSLVKMGEYENAYVHAKKLLSKKLKYSDIYYSVAKILFYLNRHDESLEFCKKVLEISPEFNKVEKLINVINSQINR